MLEIVQDSIFPYFYLLGISDNKTQIAKKQHQPTNPGKALKKLIIIIIKADPRIFGSSKISQNPNV